MSSIDYLTNPPDRTVWLFGCHVESKQITAECGCFAPSTQNGVYDLQDESGNIYRVELTDLSEPITTQYSLSLTTYPLITNAN